MGVSNLQILTLNSAHVHMVDKVVSTVCLKEAIRFRSTNLCGGKTGNLKKLQDSGVNRIVSCPCLLL